MNQQEEKELDKVFADHVQLGNSMPPQTADNMLIAYAYFKQASEGNNDHERPTHSDVIRTFKHDSWKRLSGMDKNEAKNLYIKHIKMLVDISKEEGRL